MSKQDVRDWYIMLHIGLFAAAIMTYVYLHPSDASFATGVGGLGTIIGMYHWFTQRDDKTPDAPKDP